MPEVSAMPCQVYEEGKEPQDYVCISKSDTDKLVTFLINQGEYVSLVLQCKGAPVLTEGSPPEEKK